MNIIRFISILGIVTTSNVIANFEQKIVKGRQCDVEEYSYLANIAHGKDQYCGGSFVATNWVLTAAHCCEDMKRLRSFNILAGQSVWLKDVEQTSAIDSLFMHPNYKEDPLTSDICLIKLTANIQPSKRVKLSKVPTEADWNGLTQKKQCNRALVLGHGKQRKELAKKRAIFPRIRYDPSVQCANLQVLEQKQCQGDRRISDEITDTVFCMNDPNYSGVDACQGDSGGPVYCNNMQIGVIASGFGCGDRRYPGLYIKVHMFREYILKVTGIKERSLIYAANGTTDAASSNKSTVTEQISSGVDSVRHCEALFSVVTHMLIVLLCILLS